MQTEDQSFTLLALIVCSPYSSSLPLPLLPLSLGQVRCVKEILQLKIPLSTQNNSLQTPLHLCCLSPGSGGRERGLLCLYLLLNSPLPELIKAIPLQDLMGNSFLHLLLSSSPLSSCSDKKASIGSPMGFEAFKTGGGEQGLFFMMLYRLLDLVEEAEFLAEEGALKLTKDSTNYLGQTVIHLAAENKMSGLLSILVNYVGNLDIQVI